MQKLSTIHFNPELSEGARNAVTVCLRVKPNEKVAIITDEASKQIAASIAREIESVGAQYQGWILEEHASRPLRSMPREILDDLEASDVSVYAVFAQPNELRSRMEMVDVVNRRKIRHAHMVNITERIMQEGMRADFLKVDEISTKVWDIVRVAHHVRAVTKAGTDISLEMNGRHRWVKTSGIITPERWGNLPGGEVFTAPEFVKGTYVIDGVVGDYLCAKYGHLRDEPLTVHVERSRIKEIFGNNKELEDEFWKYTHTDENSDRVGEFAIGTNIKIHEIIGNILQDEKIPGVHLAFGNPYAEQTGATWFSSTHLDVVGTKFDVWVDDRQIMNEGKFIFDEAG